jgi:hypothetical protein
VTNSPNCQLTGNKRRFTTEDRDIPEELVEPEVVEERAREVEVKVVEIVAAAVAEAGSTVSL